MWKLKIEFKLWHWFIMVISSQIHSITLAMKPGFDQVAFWVIQCKCCTWWVFFRIILKMLFFSSFVFLLTYIWGFFFFLKNTFLLYRWELDIARATQKQSQHNETSCHKTAIETFIFICTSWKFSAKKLKEYRMHLFLLALWEKALISGSLYKKLSLPARWKIPYCTEYLVQNEWTHIWLFQLKHLSTDETEWISKSSFMSFWRYFVILLSYIWGRLVVFHIVFS